MIESRSKFWLRPASVVFIILIPLAILLALAALITYWGFGIDRVHSGVFGDNFIVLADRPPIADRRTFGLLASIPALLLWSAAMWNLLIMFVNFNRGILIGVEMVKHLRAFSLYSFLAVIAGFTLSGAMRWAMGVFDNAPLWTHLGFSTTHASILLTSAIIFFASHMIEEGYRYKQETEEYV